MSARKAAPAGGGGVTTRDWADILQCSVRGVQRAMRLGILPGHKGENGRWSTTPAALKKMAAPAEKGRRGV